MGIAHVPVTRSDRTRGTVPARGLIRAEIPLSEPLGAVDIGAIAPRVAAVTLDQPVKPAGF